MAAYVIVDVDTSDPQRYEDYKRVAQETVAQYGGRYLARGGTMHILEGDWQPTRLVILEFPSFERAREWWESAAYGPAKELRQSISRTDMVLLDGYTP
ncbi:MAG TPA: DUF1330 domain-containing protein [Candidatus Baltobacteraceae bacterium]|nr:DUF1330 domain-containing protein [Candidatus Baltobacteraceae bacterium]